MPKKIRVYELAREVGLTNKEALDLALAMGIGVKSHSSSIEEAQADRVRRKVDAEGLRRAVQPEEPAEPAAEKRPAVQRPTTGVGAAHEAEPERPRLVSSRGTGAPSRPAAIVPPAAAATPPATAPAPHLAPARPPAPPLS
ncbi:MAG: translation initiation factor IF-2 N-terminal domain-containing protein, partial [Acidimicrobiales bacterium]